MKKLRRTLTTVLTVAAVSSATVVRPPSVAAQAAAPAASPGTEVGAPGSEPPAAGPSAKDKAHARELYALGQQMFKQGDFHGALRSFREAYDAVPNPVVLLSIAECQVRTEQYTDAVVSLNSYLEQRPDAPDRPQVEAQLQKLREKPGFVTVESTPGGATIFVDGQSTGLSAPAELLLPAGDHVIGIEVSGYTKAQQVVTVLIGSRQHLNLAALPEVAPAAPTMELPKVNVPQANATSTGTRAMWVATGIGGAGLVVGTVLGALAVKEKANFDRHPTEEAANKGERMALFADVGFGIAAAAGITAITLYATAAKDKDKKQQAWSIKPSLSKQNLGLSGKLRF